MSDKTEDQIREGLKLLAEDVQPPEGEAARRAWAWGMPALSPRLAIALAAAAIGATLAALAATGAFDSGHSASGSKAPISHLHGPGPMIPRGTIALMPVAADVNRSSDGTLSSVDVVLRLYSAPGPVELRLVHSTPSGDVVVYSTYVSTTPPTLGCASGPTGQSGPTGADGPTGASGRAVCYGMQRSGWSGTLVPSDWTGGCQSSGVYWVSVGSLRSTEFTCDAPPVGPTGQSGPTGSVNPVG